MEATSVFFLLSSSSPPSFLFLFFILFFGVFSPLFLLLGDKNGMLERESEELWSGRVRLLLVGRWDLTDLREQHNRNVLSTSLSLSALSLSHLLAFSWSLASVGVQSTGEGGSRLERA